jgi:hypothetical protein
MTFPKGNNYRILELVHVIPSCVALYGTTVTHFGDGENILYINKAIGLSFVISGTDIFPMLRNLVEFSASDRWYVAVRSTLRRNL